MAFRFEDPITDTSYNLGDPGGLAMKLLLMVGGIAMTAVVAAVALGQVAPVFGNLLSVLPGVQSDGVPRVPVRRPASQG